MQRPIVRHYAGRESKWMKASKDFKSQRVTPGGHSPLNQLSRALRD